MSRPTKQGIDYFPLDCQFDNETELLISEQGGISVAVLVTVWQLIYQNNGYYINDDDDLYLLIRKRLMITVDSIRVIIVSSIKRGIFCTQKHKKYKILTSKGVQSRYIIASRLKKNINIVKNYLCIDISNVKNYTYITINGIVNATKEEVEVKEEEDVNKKDELFEKFWSLYNKKTDKKKAKAKFLKLKQADIDLIFKTLPDYVKSTPDVKYRKDPSTYLNNESWNDEINIGQQSVVQQNPTNEEIYK